MTSSSSATTANSATATATGATEAGWRLAARAHRVELLLFGFSLFAYALSSWGMLVHQSNAPHFVYQAEALLHGQLHLTMEKPPNLNDWVLVNGRWYVSFPPFPAILMMPFVAFAGLGFNDTAFTVVFAALNVALLYRFLRLLGELGEEGAPPDRTAPDAASAPRSEWDHAAHALLFGFGSLAWTCAIRGEVWFTAETIGVTLTLLYLLCAVRARHPLLAGLFVACAAITRTPLAFSALFFVLEALFAPAAGAAPGAGGASEVSWANLQAVLGDPPRRALALRRLILFVIPIAAVGAPMAYANWVRFGSPGEFGHSHLYANRVNEQIRTYGLFHYQYLERNLHSAFTRLPEIQFHPLRFGFNGEGMSILVTTPLFALLLWPKARPRLHRPLWLTCAVVAIPGFFYQNSGWFQFGFRFSLDYTPYLFALLCLGRRRLTSAWWALGWAGVAVNAWGAAVFSRFF